MTNSGKQSCAATGQALREIPAGSTERYAKSGDESAGQQHFVRLEQAIGAKPIAVANPCHRVVRTDGLLSGYRWGVERKCELLSRELETAPLGKSAVSRRVSQSQ